VSTPSTRDDGDSKGQGTYDASRERGGTRRRQPFDVTRAQRGFKRGDRLPPSQGGDLAQAVAAQADALLHEGG
jgi:hypothetical protein